MARGREAARSCKQRAAIVSVGGARRWLCTVTSQPRTAPVHVLDYTDGRGDVMADLRFESENEWRVRDLDVAKVNADAYRSSIERELLEATGLKPEAAEALRRAKPELVREYIETTSPERSTGSFCSWPERATRTEACSRGTARPIRPRPAALGPPRS